MSESLDKLRKRIRSGEPAVEGMTIHYPDLVQLTAGELREACKVHPDHPLADEKLLSVADLPDDYNVICERADIQALLENGTSILEVTVEGKRRISRKRFSAGLIPAPSPLITQPTPEATLPAESFENDYKHDER